MLISVKISGMKESDTLNFSITKSEFQILNCFIVQYLQCFLNTYFTFS